MTITRSESVLDLSMNQENELTLSGMNFLIIESASFANLLGYFVLEKGGEYQGLTETEINNDNLAIVAELANKYDCIILHVSTYATYMLAKHCLKLSKPVIVLTRSGADLVSIYDAQEEEHNLEDLYRQLEKDGAELLEKDYYSTDPSGDQTYVVRLRKILMKLQNN